MGFLARFGLDARGFIRGMNEVEKVAEASTRRMVTRHRTQIDTMRDRERDEARRRAQFQRDFARGWQVATVAAAAGIASVVTSLDAAAQRNPVLARQLQEINAAAFEMRANIGEDLFGLGGRGAAEAIRGLDQVRTRVQDMALSAGIALVSGDKFGVAFANSMSNFRAIEIEREATRAQILLKQQQDNLAEMTLRFQSVIGNDPEARRTLQSHIDKKLIASSRDSGLLTGTGAAELRALVQGLRDAALAMQRSIRLGDERDALDLGRAQLNAEIGSLRDPFNIKPQEELELIQKRINLRRLETRIQKDDLLTDKEKTRIIGEMNRLYGEQTRARIEAIREQNRLRIRARDARVSDVLGDDRVAFLRATGQDRLAEVEALELGFNQRRRDIMNDRELTEDQKYSLLASGANTLRAQLRKLRQGGIDTSIEAGLAGGATLRRQILGADGRGGGESPVVQRIDTIINQIATLIDKNTVAVAAP